MEAIALSPIFAAYNYIVFFNAPVNTFCGTWLLVTCDCICKSHLVAISNVMSWKPAWDISLPTGNYHNGVMKNMVEVAMILYTPSPWCTGVRVVIKYSSLSAWDIKSLALNDNSIIFQCAYVAF